MTKEELKQEAEEYAEGMAKYYASTHEDCIPSQFEKYLRNAYISSAEPREKQITRLSKHILELQKDKGNLIDRCRELEQQIEKMKKYGKLLQDICVVMGNDPYMVWRGLEQRVLILWDKSEEEEGLKMAENILDRLLKIKPHEWTEIDEWEMKEK